MKTTIKRSLSFVLLFALLLQILPASVLGAQNYTEGEQTGDSLISQELVAERSETTKELLSSAEVLFEEESLREESIKHFRMEDGSYLAVQYDTPVHYRGEDGKWVDYDNTLQAVRTSDNRTVSSYQVVNGESTRIFAANADTDALLMMQKGEYSLTIAPIEENAAVSPSVLQEEEAATPALEAAQPSQSASEEAALPTDEDDLSEKTASVLTTVAPAAEAIDDALLEQIQPEKLYSALEYTDALNNATLRYENYANAIKESIVIPAPNADYTYTFRLSTEGLLPTLQDDGSILLAAEDGKVIYTIPAPYMIDANDELSYDAAYTLTALSGDWLLSVTADKDWMNDSIRAFPVLLDPTVEEQALSESALSASYVRSGYPSSPGVAEAGVYVGNNGNVNKKTRSYFHINSLPTLPVGCEISYAGFSLYQYAHTGTGSLDVALYGMEKLNGASSSSMSSAQWASYINALTWNSVTASSTAYEQRTFLSDKQMLSSATAGTRVTWDVTTLAYDWFDGRNLGFALIPLNEDTTTARATLYGPRATSNLPTFIVQYRNTVGLEDYYTYQPVGIGRAGTAYIGDYAMQSTVVVPLLASASNVMPFSLSLVYNSAYGSGLFTNSNSYLHTKSFSNMNLGVGWKLSAQQTVVPITLNNATYLVYTDGDGTEHYFNRTNGVYKDEDGLGLSISVSGSNYTMTDQVNNTLYFGNGYLKWMHDAYGNQINYNYNASAQLSSITRLCVGGSTETLATFVYTGGKLTSVTDEAGRVTRFAYATIQSNNCLTEINYPDGKKAQYDYYNEDTFYCKARLKTALDCETNCGTEFSYSYNKDVRNVYVYSNTEPRAYSVKFHGYKRTHSQAVYRLYGDDLLPETADDIFCFCVLDAYGRSIGSYSTDSTEAHVLGTGYAAYQTNSGTSKKNNTLITAAATGQQGVNLLRNGSAEDGDHSVNAIGSWNRSAASYARAGLTAYAGSASLSFVRTAFSATLDRWYQTVTLTPQSSYTFSAYVYVPNGAQFSSGGGVYLALRNSSGTEYAKSLPVSYSTQGTNDGWQRISLTYENSGTASLSVQATLCATNYTGTLFADCVQLEQESVLSSYNLLEDASFESLSSFPTSAVGSWYRYNTCNIGSTAGTYFGSKYAEIPGSSVSTRISQNVPLSKAAGTTFLLSGWAKGAADPESVAAKTADSDLFFGLIVRLYYSGNTSEVFYLPFDSYYTDWQFAQRAIIPSDENKDKTILSATVVASYDKNINTALFDNISLYVAPAQCYSYDDNGNPITSAQTGTGEQHAVYSGVDLTQLTIANGNRINYTYNTQHDVLTSSFDEVKSTYIYNSSGDITSSELTATAVDEYGALITNSYLLSTATATADRNHTATATDVNGDTTTYTYNNSTEQLTSVKNANNITTNYTYEISGRQQQISQGTHASIDYTYAAGKLTQLDRKSYYSGTDKHQNYYFAYNSWGQQLSISIGNKKLADYEYEPNGGNLTKMVYGDKTVAANPSVTYEYDEFDRRTKVQYNSGRYVTYQYTAEGGIAKLTYGDGTTEKGSYYFEYDSLGRLIRSSEYSGNGVLVQRTEHLYDEFGRLSSQKWVLGTTPYAESYAYDDGINGNGSLTQMTAATGNTLNYTYDGLKRLSGMTVKDGADILFTTAYAYATVSGNRSSAQVQYRNVRLGTTTQILEGKKYEYDALGNITKIYEPVSAPGSGYREVAAYTYDSQSQLVSEVLKTYDGTSTTPETTDTYTYTYDTAGNIFSVSENGDTVKSYTYGDSQWIDLLTAVNGHSITYDNSGNPISYYNGSSYTGLTWEQGRNLTRITTGGKTTTYAYDQDGIRTQKTVNGVLHTYITQNGKVVRETIGTGSTAKVLDFIYDEAGRPFALNYSTNGGSSFNTYYYILNLQGDVIKLVEYIPGFSYSAEASYTYDAWGNILTATGDLAEINPLRYRGYYYDTETGFYYLQSRYYDPANRRFINADSYASTGQDFIGYNMFAYCGNNPVNRADPSGHFWEELWEFAKTAFNEIGNAMGLMSPAYAGCGGVALADGPLPIGDIIGAAGAVLLTVGAIGYGIYQATQAPSISIPKVEEKEKDITAPHPKRNPNYWTAEIINDQVVPITPLTYSEARVCVETGKNILCINHAAAIAIVKFYPTARWDSAHNGGKDGYLNHYHLSSAHKNHIWYYGE